MKPLLPLPSKSLLALALFSGCIAPLKAQTNATDTNAAAPAATPAAQVQDPSFPVGGANYSGSLKGKVVTNDPQGKSFSVTVSSVTPNDKNQASNATELVGKTVVVFPSNLQNAQGKWVQAKEDIFYIGTLKPGQDVHFSVYTRTAKPSLLFLDWYPGRSGKKTPSDS